MACTPEDLSAAAKCFMCLSEKQLLAIIAYGTCVNGGEGGGQQIETGGFADPNGSVTPADPTLPAIYYQDQASPINEWNWSVSGQVWFPKIT